MRNNKKEHPYIEVKNGRIYTHLDIGTYWAISLETGDTRLVNVYVDEIFIEEAEDEEEEEVITTDELVNYRLSNDHTGNYIMDSDGRIGKVMFTCYLDNKYCTIADFDGEYFISVREGDTAKVFPILSEIVDVLKELPIVDAEYCR